MKHLIKPWLLIFILNVLGCESYLSEPRSHSYEVNSTEDLPALLIRAYPTATPLAFTVKASDNVTFIPGSTANIDFNFFVYRYQLPIGKVRDSNQLNTFWVNCYYAIAQANLALEKINQITNTNPSLKEAIRGEALLCRAYSHFMLANVFCQAYSDQADQHLGIPYLTTIEKELVTHYERGTLKETYEKIEADLLAGLPLIENHQYKGFTAKYHFSKESALAFASRFFLFKQDYTQCVKYSNSLLGAGTVSTVSTFIRDAYEVFQRGGGAAGKFQSLSAPYNLLFLKKHDCGVCHYSDYRFEPNDDTFSEVFANNIQRAEDYRNIQEGNFIYTDGPRFTPKHISNIYVVFRSEEVIFNRMESYVRLEMKGKQPNGVERALADYHVIASQRYENGREITQQQIITFFGGTPQEAMLKFILSERRKEFFDEGLRWFDIKRHGLSIIHKDDNKTFTLHKQDPRKAFQLPWFAIAQGIKENPGWGE